MKKKLLVLITIVSVMSWILIPGVFADSVNRGNTNKGQTHAVDKGKTDAQHLKEARAAIKSTYSSEELNTIEQLTEKIKKQHKDITVLSVDSIVAKGRNIKFDTPPVIKDGRTLIPVRALSEAFGATVAWDPVEKKVTISSGTTQIVLTLDSNVVYVNGVEKTIDAAPMSLNNRTIVPLRFITETLGLKVDWDDETDTVEIGDGATTPTTGETTTPTTTTPTTTTPTTTTPTTTTPTTTTPTDTTTSTTTPATDTSTQTPSTDTTITNPQ